MLFTNLRTPLNDLQKELETFFQAPYCKRTTRFPLINMVGKKDQVIVFAELPGVSPEHVDITIQDDILTITGNREQKDTENLKARERKFGKFERNIRLPFKADLEKVSAEYKNGILSVTLHQAAEDKPRKIEIK